MIGAFAIDYRPAADAVPSILTIVAEAGYKVRGLKITPTLDASRATLSLDINEHASHAELVALEARIMAGGAAIKCMHVATGLNPAGALVTQSASPRV